MFDKMMFWVYSFSVAYHSIRGSGMGKWDSLEGAYKVTAESKLEKTVAEFQKNMWTAMQEIAKERKI